MGFALVPAAYVYLLREGAESTEVLLQLRGPESAYRPLHWAAAAAGHVEAGESVFEAAAREATEELGVVVEELEPLCVLHRTETGNSDPVEQRVDFFLTTRTWVGEARIMETAKCADLRWFPLTQLPEPMVPHERMVLDRMADGLAGEGLPPFLTYGF